MRSFLTLISSLVIVLSYGQGFSYPIVNQSGQSIEDFVPIGWTILNNVTGDLNRDKLTDVVIILQHKDSVLLAKSDDIEDTVLTQPRILIVLFRTSSGNNFYLVEQNNSFILSHDNPTMDDPYQGVKIYKGFLQIDFHLFYNMGSWYTTSSSYKFRYQDKQFILIGADYSSIHRATLDFEDYSYNFLTKRRSLTKGNDKKRTKKVYWKTLNIQIPKTLATFNMPYSWEVETDIYL